LDFVVGAYLYHKYPEMHEGDLTSLRAALVRTDSLAKFALAWELGRFLRLGYGEAENGGRERLPILCAAFEALVGAVYLDRGLTAVQTLVQPMLGPALVNILEESLHKDAKSEFQVWAQAQYNITPRYKVVATSGPDHAKEFTVQVMVEDMVWGVGNGRSKQHAAQAAARMALLKAEQVEE
jgi:ribonuclease-3